MLINRDNSFLVNQIINLIYVVFCIAADLVRRNIPKSCVGSAILDI